MFVQYEQKVLAARSGSPKLMKLITDLQKLTNGSLNGLNILFLGYFPPYLTPDYIYKLRLEINRGSVRKTAEAVKAVLARLEDPVNNRQLLIDLRDNIDRYDDLTEALKRDHPQIKDLDYHPLNYLLIAESELKKLDKDGFGKWSAALKKEFNDVSLKMLQTKLTPGEIDEILAEYEKFDPRNAN